jgi:hypothetical protein
MLWILLRTWRTLGVKMHVVGTRKVLFLKPLAPDLRRGAVPDAIDVELEEGFEAASKEQNFNMGSVLQCVWIRL